MLLRTFEDHDAGRRVEGNAAYDGHEVRSVPVASAGQGGPGELRKLGGGGACGERHARDRQRQ